MDENDEIFEKVMESVGNDGPFQRRYNYIYNVIGVLLFAMGNMNMVPVLSEPKHSCHVHGMEKYNISDLELWKNITLPRQINSKGEDSHSYCQMYNITDRHFEEHYQNWKFTDADVIACSQGHDYDKTYYDRTPITENDWVCDKELYPTNALVIARLSDMIGSFIFGPLGDTIGRLPLYLFSIFGLIFGRLISMFTASIYIVFTIGVFIGNFPALSSFQTPMIVTMEICKSEARSTIAMQQMVFSTIGVSVVSLFLWWLKDWFWFILVTTLPCAILACFPKYNIESPRWLLTKGNYKKCAEELTKIAAVNGKKDFVMSEEKLKGLMKHNKTETVYGMASLFSSWQLAKNTTLLSLCFIIGGLPVYTLVYLSTRLDGNPFLNFFFQSIINIPGFLVGQIMCDRIGRRFTNAVSMICAALSCIPIYLIIKNSEYEVYTTLFVVVVKFWSCIATLAATLQGVEIYPTCVRQSAVAFCCIMSLIPAVLGPYIVLLGTNYDMRYPFIIMGVGIFVASFISLFLPESLHQNLPQTMEEAKVFGKDQAFWTLPKKTLSTEKVNKDDIELN